MRAKEQTYLDELGLISFERMDVFDLLVETLLKKRENIILTGAIGVGKTTLLQTLEREKKAQWTLCVFYGTTILSFSDIKEALRRVLREQGNIPETEKLHDMLDYYEEHKKRIILILDNARRFPSGFMEGLIQYSLKYPALKIVFVLTKKQLLLKNKTDKAVDHCYFMEIPALEKKQLGVFLTMLATTPDPLLAATEIKPKLINQLYISSKGMPKAVIALLHKRKTFWYRGRKYILFLLFLLLGAGGIYHYSSALKQHKWFKTFFLEPFEAPKKKFSATIKPTLLMVNDSAQIDPKTLLSSKNNAPDVLEKIQLSEKKVTKKALENLDREANIVAETPSTILAITPIPVIKNRVSESIDDTLEASAIKQVVVDLKKPDEPAPLSNIKENSGSIQQKKNTLTKQPPKTKKPEKLVKKVKKITPKFSDNSQWVLQKSARKYTLQLMITPNKRALLKILKRYSQLKSGLKYVQVTRNNKQQYLLLYGNFSSVASAQHNVKTLPKPFKAAWPKQFGAIQTEIKKSR